MNNARCTYYIYMQFSSNHLVTWLGYTESMESSCAKSINVKCLKTKIPFDDNRSFKWLPTS